MVSNLEDEMRISRRRFEMRFCALFSEKLRNPVLRGGVKMPILAVKIEIFCRKMKIF